MKYFIEIQTQERHLSKETLYPFTLKFKKVKDFADKWATLTITRDVIYTYKPWAEDLLNMCDYWNE